jgi:hypothetical protein
MTARGFYGWGQLRQRRLGVFSEPDPLANDSDHLPKEWFRNSFDPENETIGEHLGCEAFGPGAVSIREDALVQLRAAEVHLPQHATCEINPDEGTATEVGACQVGMKKLRVADLEALEVGVGECGPIQPRVPQTHRGMQVGSGQVRRAQVNPLQL